MAEFMYADGKLYPSKQEDVKLVDVKQGIKILCLIQGIYPVC